MLTPQKSSEVFSCTHSFSIQAGWPMMGDQPAGKQKLCIEENTLLDFWGVNTLVYPK
jgi:hypothetical protein